MARNRFDETWHRLREWTKGQTPSERLAAQILIHEGFQSLDPSHPLGGRDGGKDAIADKHGVRFAMAVYFPRGQQTFNDIRTKFEGDCVGAKQNSAKGIAFVTNQELTLGQRETLKTSAEPLVVELYHRDRITTILDTPDMASVRQQFLDIEADSRPAIHLGGEGGRAPSAGGGGGAAIGPRSQGGRGGDGGGRRIEDGEYTLPWIEDVSRPQFMDQQFQQGWEEFLGFVPGAGGGGAGAIGDGVSGGDGGSGGEWVSAQIDMAALRNAGFDRIEYTVGKGGAGPRLPGQHAPDGEDTVVNFLAKDGTILKTIRAAGGRGAKSGAPHLPDGVAELSASDIDGGFRITTLMTVNAAEHRDGSFSSWGVTGYAFMSRAFPSTQYGMWSAERDGARLSGRFHEGYSFH